MHVLITR
jgi:hypothetical protein